MSRLLRSYQQSHKLHRYSIYICVSDYKRIADTPVTKEHIWRIRVLQNGD